MAAAAAHVGRPGLVYFYSARSGACRRTEGFLAQVLQRRRNHGTFHLYRVEKDDRPDLLQRFRVDRVPTLVVVEAKTVKATARVTSRLPRDRALPRTLAALDLRQPARVVVRWSHQPPGGSMRARAVWATLACVCLLGSASVSSAAPPHDFAIEVLVVALPTMVTGGDALVQVTIPTNVPLAKATVPLNGPDVTGVLCSCDDDARTLTGMVTGLRLGANTLFVDSNGHGNGRPTEQLTLVNHPVTGPIFSGPQQQPFVCKTQTQGLGFPQVDNQDGIGMRLFQTPGNPATPRSAGARTAPSPTSSTTSTARPAGTVQAAAGRPAAGGRRARRRRSTAAPSRTSSGASAGRSTASSTRSRSSRRPATRRARRTRRSGTAA